MTDSQKLQLQALLRRLDEAQALSAPLVLSAGEVDTLATHLACQAYPVVGFGSEEAEPTTSGTGLTDRTTAQPSEATVRARGRGTVPFHPPTIEDSTTAMEHP